MNTLIEAKHLSINYGRKAALQDLSFTVPAGRVVGLLGPDVSGAGLITFDAHHDLRDGWSNGSPVRQLMQAGLQGRLE